MACKYLNKGQWRLGKMHYLQCWGARQRGRPKKTWK